MWRCKEEEGWRNPGGLKDGTIITTLDASENTLVIAVIPSLASSDRMAWHVSLASSLAITSPRLRTHQYGSQPGEDISATAKRLL